LEKLVIIPTYNERDNVASVLETVFSLQQNFHVLIVDDSSPDGTAEIVKRLFAKYT
jgi:dolichol-phosphate mannosyltransferase